MKRTARLSTIFKLGDVVRVPFPYIERERLKMRPAVIVSSRLVGGEARLSWSIMITSAANGGWPDDVSLNERFGECGLRIPCVIRTAKITAFESHSASLIGRLPSDLLDEVRQKIAGHLDLQTG